MPLEVQQTNYFRELEGSNEFQFLIPAVPPTFIHDGKKSTG